MGESEETEIVKSEVKADEKPSGDSSSSGRHRKNKKHGQHGQRRGANVLQEQRRFRQIKVRRL